MARNEAGATFPLNLRPGDGFFFWIQKGSLANKEVQSFCFQSSRPFLPLISLLL